MSSIWTNGTTAEGASPFRTSGIAPKPGGANATRFQSALESAGKTGPQAALPVGRGAVQPGLSPRAGSSGGAGPATSSAGTADSSDSSATISANDFLTLLVTEMQNQDPTSDTDPNAYVDQLVQINSLEQLISINQNLQTVLGAATSPVTPTTPSASRNAHSAGAADSAVLPGSGPKAAPKHGTGANAASTQTSQTGALSRSSGLSSANHGNLSIPRDAPAAHRVARALDGHATRPAHRLRDIPTH